VRAVDFDALFERWRAGDAEGAAAYFASDAVYREARHAPVSGRAAIAAHWAPFFRSGPAWRFTVHERFGDGERFAVAYTWEVRDADGHWQARPGCAIVRVRDGAIAEWSEYTA
jgi:ketosteroid isomerase-like protein